MTTKPPAEPVDPDGIGDYEVDTHLGRMTLQITHRHAAKVGAKAVTAPANKAVTPTNKAPRPSTK